MQRLAQFTHVFNTTWARCSTVLYLYRSRHLLYNSLSLTFPIDVNAPIAEWDTVLFDNRTRVMISFSIKKIGINYTQAEGQNMSEISSPILSQMLQWWISSVSLIGLWRIGKIYVQSNSIHPSSHLLPLIRGRVAEVAVPAESPKRSFPWPHQPALTGGIPRRSQASEEI